MNGVKADNLAIRLLDFSQLHEEIPKAGFGNDCVGSEYAHTVEFGCWVGLRWEMAANDLVFIEATCKIEILVRPQHDLQRIVVSRLQVLARRRSTGVRTTRDPSLGESDNTIYGEVACRSLGLCCRKPASFSM